jgi:hypothetical protein
MELGVWIPLTLMLGFFAFGILFAFIVACEKV